MKRWIGVAIVAGLLGLAVPVSTETAAAAPRHAAQLKVDAARATDFSAQRYRGRRHAFRSYHPNYRRYDGPYYNARPTYYRPYPYSVPAPFPFGLGFGPGPFGW